MNEVTTTELVRRLERMKMAMMLAGAAVLVVFAVLVVGIARQQHLSKEVTGALCRQRASDVASLAFLNKHQGGLPVFGLSAKGVQRLIASTTKDIESLRGVSCQ